MFNSLQISAKARQVTDAKEKLAKAWKAKDDYIKEVLKQQQILRDAKQLDTISTTQEVGMTLVFIAIITQNMIRTEKLHLIMSYIYNIVEQSTTI